MKRIAIGIAALILTACIILIPWIFQLNERIKNSLDDLDLAQPTRFYAGVGILRPGDLRSQEDIQRYLDKLEYRRRSPRQPLRQGDYHFPEKCPEGQKPSNTCLELVTRDSVFDESQKISLLWYENSLVEIFVDDQPVEQAELEALEFAQFLESEPILRDQTVLGETPPACLNAVLAIEDPQFLKHTGISPTGMLRSLYVNIIKGGFAQGGSTITQQVVRNSWLTLKKKLSRKITEIFMAVLLEFHVPKDHILQMYLNIIYMGQSGPYQVRGFKAAAEHYYDKDLKDLNVPECALLAAVLNSPGLYNPFRKPENARKRRKRVLQRMLEFDYISQNEFETANNSPLPTQQKKNLIKPTLWFVESVKKTLSSKGVSWSNGQILTTMNFDAQLAAYESVKDSLTKLDERPTQKKTKQNLQASLISADVQTGQVYALIGGRDYRRAPFNRALSAHRQVGSLMKPLVYLSALESLDSDGQNYTPLHAINDERFTHKFENQSWSPENYTKKTHGRVPLYWAMKNSLNIATAKLGLQVGLSQLIDISRRMGVKSDLKALPALTLGAFEMYPIEMLQIYLTIANFGKMVEPQLVKKVVGPKGELVFETAPKYPQVVDANTVAVLVGMMKHTVKSGTGVSLSTWRRFHHPAAGKTGTTSDNRDAWFAGFIPDLATIVWVGNDNNATHGLTGASGAIPIWSSYMKKVAQQYEQKDFSWPDGVRTEFVDMGSLEKQPAEIVLRKFSESKRWN